MKLKYTADDVRYTTKGKTVYAITLGVPEAGKTMTFKSFKRKIKALKIEKCFGYRLQSTRSLGND